MISIFTTVGHQGQTMKDIEDPWKEAYECYNDLADDVQVVEGFDDWPVDFSWEVIGQHFQKGYEQCKGDWVIHADLDFFFHEKDHGAIREAFEMYKDAPAVSFWKYQFLLGDRYRLKSRLVIAVNKGKYGDRIKFNSGGDLCQPSLDGKEIKPDSVPEARIPFYNYDFLGKTQKRIAYEFHRMAKARNKIFPNDNWGIESEEAALEKFKQMQVGKFNNNVGWKKIPLKEHPKYIQDRLKNLTPNEFGFNMFGWVDEKCHYE